MAQQQSPTRRRAQTSNPLASMRTSPANRLATEPPVPFPVPVQVQTLENQNNTIKTKMNDNLRAEFFRNSENHTPFCLSTLLGSSLFMVFLFGFLCLACFMHRRHHRDRHSGRAWKVDVDLEATRRPRRRRRSGYDQRSGSEDRDDDSEEEDDDSEASDFVWNEDEDEEEEEDESTSVSHGLSSGRSLGSFGSGLSPLGTVSSEEIQRGRMAVHRGGGSEASYGRGESDDRNRTRKRTIGVRERVDGFVDRIVDGFVEYMREEKEERRSEMPVWRGEGVRTVERLNDADGAGMGGGVRRERKRMWKGENLKLDGLKRC
ncbi:MAG: hypothetical protein M1830_000604 [Pleopsidium flavum]|nr:MAG: hypothetical protein M1830_000604 [Pleopsidium flavum]